MISYTEKGAGLHEAVARAGYLFRQENGVWMSSDDAAVQVLIDAYTLADAAAYVGTQIDAHAKWLRDKVVKAASPGEMASWSIKRAEAEAFTVSANESDAPMLLAEATARGCTLQAIVTRVLANASALGSLEANISGTGGKHKDAIKALPSFDAIAAYDWSTGWPAV